MACSGVPPTTDLSGAASKNPVSATDAGGASSHPAAHDAGPGDPGYGDGGANVEAAADAPVALDGDVAPASDASDGPGDDAGTLDAGDSPDSGGTIVTPDAAGTSSDAATATTIFADVVFFGWADNAPPGNQIAYPKTGGFPTKHTGAGGTGSYADPITFGSDSSRFPPGTILYVPYLEKYVIMEDECQACAMQALTTHRPELAIWMTSNAATPPAPLANCEMVWTRSSISVTEKPPADRLVTTRPLLDPATRSCRTTP